MSGETAAELGRWGHSSIRRVVLGLQQCVLRFRHLPETSSVSSICRAAVCFPEIRQAIGRADTTIDNSEEGQRVEATEENSMQVCIASITGLGAQFVSTASAAQS